MSYAPTQEQRWDHARDLAKHEPRPTDPIPHRLDKPLSTAMDIVLIVRGMSNLEAAASLVDSYADLKAAGARLEQQQETADRILAQFEVPNV